MPVLSPARSSLPQYGRGRRFSSAAVVAAAIAAALYGASIALFTPVYLLELALPLILLALLVVWSLPDTGRGPVKLVSRLFFAFFIMLLVWPDYLALDIPGLPWITMRRLISAPLALVFLIALSVSFALRAEIKASLAASPILTRCFLGFVALQFLSVALSRNPGLSIDKLIVAQLYWTLPFFVGCYVFRQPGRVERWAALLCLLFIPLLIFGLWEWSRGKVPWAGRIPSFLVVGDEVVQRILTGGSRAATGRYRIQSTFTTSLGFAEYMALTTPFLIHFAVGAYKPFVRVASVVALPVVFHMIVLTDSRLGAAGFLLSFILYLGVYAVLRWRHHRDSLFGPAITLAFPAIFAAFIAATFFIGRLRRMVWGGGEHQFSTDAREEQYARGFDILAGNPIGHGIGMGAERLGFTNLAGVLTIDTYYLLIALEYGVIGFLLYYGMMLIGVGKAWAALFRAREIDRETMLLVPLIISTSVFVVIKSVFSQESNHSLVFMMLAAILALVDRLRRQAAGTPQLNPSLRPMEPSPERRAVP